MANSPTVFVKVTDARGIVEGEKFYGKGDTLEMDRVRFEILSRAVKVVETPRPKPKKAKTDGGE